MGSHKILTESALAFATLHSIARYAVQSRRWRRSRRIYFRVERGYDKHLAICAWPSIDRREFHTVSPLR